MPASDYTPTVAAVGAILRARTKDVDGNEAGTFNDDTRPTGAQVTSIITTAVQDVEDFVGSEIDEELYDNAASAATYRAAMLVELSYFPESVGNNDKSMYDRLKDLWEEKIKALKEAVAQASAGDEFGAVEDIIGPAYEFPEDDDTYPGMVGWQSRF